MEPPSRPVWQELVPHRGFLCGEEYGHGGRAVACPGSRLSPAAPHHLLPSRSLSLPERCARKGEAPAPSRRAEVAKAAEGSLEGRKGRREKGRGEGSGGGGRGRVIACLSVLLSAQEGACVCGGGCSFALRSMCLLSVVSVCLSQGSRLSLAPALPFVFWGARLWAHPAVLRADAADVAGPQLCLLPGEGEGAAICSPDNGC